MTRHHDRGEARTVTIASSAFEAIRTEVMNSCPDLETGGILLGRPATRSAELHVTVAGDPGPTAVHEPRRFLRDPIHAQTLADRAWRDHGAVWVGEWHTHPAAGLLPSDIDLRSYLRHLDDPELGFEEFVSLIVAGTEAGPGVVAWILNRTELAEAHLEVTSDDHAAGDDHTSGEHPEPREDKSENT